MYHALLNNHRGVRMEQHCLADRRDRPGDVYHPSFLNGRTAYFDLTVKNTLQPGFLARGAPVAGIAADAGVAAKDVTHADAVTSVGGEFYPLVVESFGVWLPPPSRPCESSLLGPLPTVAYRRIVACRTSSSSCR